MNLLSEKLLASLLINYLILIFSIIKSFNILLQIIKRNIVIKEFILSLIICFSHDNYAFFMITMKIGKQGLPLWFHCFKQKPSEAFQESLIMESLSYICELFESDYDLIFLANHWFNSINVMKHIETLKYTYCLRLKRNIKILIYDKKENRKT